MSRMAVPVSGIVATGGGLTKRRTARLLGNRRTNAHLLGGLFGQQSPNRMRFCSVLPFASLE